MLCGAGHSTLHDRRSLGLGRALDGCRSLMRSKVRRHAERAVEGIMRLPGSREHKRPIATVAGCLGAIAMAAVAAGGIQPVEAGGAGLSYQQVTRVMFQQQTTPAPGTYPNGSFDADFQAASAGAKPRGQGLFNTIKWAVGAVQGLRTGEALTIYEWNGMRREDRADQTSTIDIPAKNEQILLNLATKTYEIIDESQQAEPMESMGPMPTMPPMNSPPPMKPGTAVVYITTTTTDPTIDVTPRTCLPLIPSRIAGVAADGRAYSVFFLSRSLFNLL